MSATATIPDLWPTDFNVGSEPSPATILRQQGYILGERTRNVVFGEVESSMAGEAFSHHFFINAPFCKVRQFTLIASHGLQPYPVRLVVVGVGGVHLREATAANAEHFSELLRAMLASPQIIQLVGSLMAQAREIDDE